MRIGMIGLGKLGLPVAEVMAERYAVLGYDIADVSSDTIDIVPDLKQLVTGSDIIFISVQTPHDRSYDGSVPSSHLPNRDFDYTHVESVLRDLDPLVDESKTVVLISTVLPGTIRHGLAHLLPNAELIYNPYLIAMGTVAHDTVNPEMLMIGTKNGEITQGASRLVDLYANIARNSPRIVIGTWEEMESTKIFYNTFISAKLSLVNMIQDVAERVGHMNVDVVAKALADSTHRITGPAYMRPGMGDGGPCHPRDNIALRHMAERLDLGYDLFDAIMRAREVQAENLASELCRHGLPVFIWGESFKPGVSYTDGSYSRLVGHYCSQAGRRVIYDAVSTEPAAYLLGHDVDYSASLAKLRRGSVIVDPWRRTMDMDGFTVIRWGDTRNRQPKAS